MGLLARQQHNRAPTRIPSRIQWPCYQAKAGPVRIHQHSNCGVPDCWLAEDAIELLQLCLRYGLRKQSRQNSAFGTPYSFAYVDTLSGLDRVLNVPREFFCEFCHVTSAYAFNRTDPTRSMTPGTWALETLTVSPYRPT